jgi:hypothetical protein
MSEHVYLLTIGLPLLAVLLVFAMKYGSAAVQVRARLENDSAYRDIAEKAAALQARSVSSLAAIEGELSEIKTRLGAIEKVLKEVG